MLLTCPLHACTNPFLAQAWKAVNSGLAADLAAGAHVVPDAAALFAKIPAFAADAKIATRKAGQDVLQPISAAIPNSVSGSADLHGSTLNYIAASGDFGPANSTGRNIRFGIREHGMGGIANGINYDGLFRCSCATFLVFTDYLRGSMRVAALSHVPTVLSHLLSMAPARHKDDAYTDSRCTAGLHFHARQRWCGRGWSHAPAR